MTLSPTCKITIAEQAGLSLTLLEIPKIDFLMSNINDI